MTPSKRLHTFIMNVFSFGVRNPDLGLPGIYGAISDVNAVQRAERFNSVRKIVRAQKPPVSRPKATRVVRP
jgi:hypothetical protein